MLSQELCQLKSDGDAGGYIHRPAIAGSGAESNLLRHADSLLIEAVAKTLEHAVNDNLAARKECHTQHDIALDARLTRFSRVLNRRLRDDFDASGLCLCGSVDRRSGDGCEAGHHYHNRGRK